MAALRGRATLLCTVVGVGSALALIGTLRADDGANGSSQEGGGPSFSNQSPGETLSKPLNIGVYDADKKSMSGVQLSVHLDAFNAVKAEQLATAPMYRAMVPGDTTKFTLEVNYEDVSTMVPVVLSAGASMIEVYVVNGQVGVKVQNPIGSLPSGSIGGGVAGTGGGSDDCAGAEAIAGNGSFDFDTTNATTDGNAHADCEFFGEDQTNNDVWFCWTAEDDGNTRIETCGQTALDTKIVVYGSCDPANCPPGDDLVVTCNDDDCGLQSGVDFDAVAGESYLVRVGSFSPTGFGSGTFSVQGPGGGTGGADACAEAESISGEGVFAFDNSNATTDGPPNDLCLAFGSDQVESDVWFCWTAPCDALVRIETCGQTSVDTKMAVYDGCSCDDPTGGSQLGPILDCNDDSCGLQSTVSFDAVAGGEYLIRIGTFPSAPGGPGNFSIECVVTKMICEQPDENCQDFGLDNAFTSNSTAFTTADDFVLEEAATVTNVCWWGAYQPSPGPAPDDFTVEYWDASGPAGLPGNLLGSFSQSGGSLAVSGPVDTGQLILGIAPVWEYTGDHAPVELGAGCYWLSIRNDPTDGSTWFWEQSFDGNNRFVQDGFPPDGFDPGDLVLEAGDTSFCLGAPLGDPIECLPPPAMNDDCENATPIEGEGIFAFDNSAATTDGPPDPLCDVFDSDQVENDVWFCWTAPCTGDVRIQTCGLTSVDTKIAAYDGCACGEGIGPILACNDDACGFQSSIQIPVVEGGQYLIRIGTFPGATGGFGSFDITCVVIPDNDECENAIALDGPGTVSGTTDFAGVDFAPDCGSAGTPSAGGVWYSLVGDGTTWTVSLCEGTGYDSKLSVYCGDCGDLACVDGNDDACGLQSEVTWCSQAGANYLILVHGFGGATGDFELTLSSDDMPCDATVFCIPVGACCIAEDPCAPTCVRLTEEECMSAGGVYQGDDTLCQGAFLGYDIEECTVGYNSIAGMDGVTELFLGDDAGEVVPIGFNFNFFGNDFSSIGVSSNGYLSFGNVLTSFGNATIPNAAPPNDLIAPFWDDLNPTDGGSIRYGTFSEPTRLMVEWDAVPEFGTGGAETASFQAVLFPNGNIDFRYGPLVGVPSAPGDVTIGVEDETGTIGFSVPDTSIAEGTCLRFVPSFDNPFECPAIDDEAPVVTCSADRLMGDQVSIGYD
ncbi:MAG: hypothetical protein ACYTGC_02515, partial [Planctomycetota bacterium]